MLIADTEDVIFIRFNDDVGVFLHGLPVYYYDEIFNDEIEEIPERTLEGVISISAEELKILLEGIEKELFESNLLRKDSVTSHPQGRVATATSTPVSGKHVNPVFQG